MTLKLYKNHFTIQKYGSQDIFHWNRKDADWKVVSAFWAQYCEVDVQHVD